VREFKEAMIVKRNFSTEIVAEIQQQAAVYNFQLSCLFRSKITPALSRV